MLLSPLESLRDVISILGGLSHPEVRKMKFKNLVLLFALVPAMAWLGASDHREKQSGPKPNRLMQKSRLLELTGKFDDAKLSKEVRILWLSGPEDHGGGEHDYIRVKELFVPDGWRGNALSHHQRRHCSPTEPPFCPLKKFAS